MREIRIEMPVLEHSYYEYSADDYFDINNKLEIKGTPSQLMKAMVMIYYDFCNLPSLVHLEEYEKYELEYVTIKVPNKYYPIDEFIDKDNYNKLISIMAHIAKRKDFLEHNRERGKTK